MSNLLGPTKLAKALGIAIKTVYNYRDRSKGEPDDPFASRKPLKADPDVLRQWIRSQDASRPKELGGARVKLAPKKADGAVAEPRLSLKRPRRDNFVDVEKIEADLKAAEDATNNDDMASLRRSCAKLESILDNFQLEHLEDRQVARIFGNYTDTLSKLYERIAKLEALHLDLAVKRGELITIEQSAAISEALVNCLYVNVDELIQGVVDQFKAEEIETYQKSSIDSDKLIDLVHPILADFKTRCFEDMKKSLSPTGEESEE